MASKSNQELKTGEKAINQTIGEVDTSYLYSIEGQVSYGRGFLDGLCAALYIISTDQKEASPFYPPKEYIEKKERWEKDAKRKRVFGSLALGDWICPNCKYHIFPATLLSLQDKFAWTLATEEGELHPCCPKCATTLQNDEQPIK